MKFKIGDILKERNTGIELKIIGIRCMPYGIFYNTKNLKNDSWEYTERYLSLQFNKLINYNNIWNTL